MSLDINSLGNAKPIRSPKNRMVVLILNMDEFSFIAFKIWKARSKIPMVRVNEHSYLPYLSPNEMRA